MHDPGDDLRRHDRPEHGGAHDEDHGGQSGHGEHVQGDLAC